MAVINDLNTAGPFAEDDLDAAMAANESQFGRGMRSGTLSLRAGANNFSGAVADRLGFKDFAQGEFAEADDLSLRAQQAAPRVSSVRDISSLRDFGDWGAGVVGQIDRIEGAPEDRSGRAFRRQVTEDGGFGVENHAVRPLPGWRACQWR